MIIKNNTLYRQNKTQKNNDLFIVKYFKGEDGYINIGKIRFPKEFIGRRVRIKVEVVELHQGEHCIFCKWGYMSRKLKDNDGNTTLLCDICGAVLTCIDDTK